MTIVLAIVAFAAAPALARRATYAAGAIREVSRCPGQNAEVEQAVDETRDYVFEEWIGCNGIGFARSTDGGEQFSRPIVLRGSGGAWDPALAVAGDGTVYAAFMVTRGTRTLPVVLTSFNHGVSFPRATFLTPPRKNNWGDRDFIAAGPGGGVYVTWDYGPSNSNVRLVCFAIGSCAFTAGEFNIVLQASTNGGKSFGPMVHVSPGFPASGGVSGPLVVEPSGKIDVLYTRYPEVRRRTHTLGAGGSYFTSSTDGGGSWMKPVRVGRSAGTISPSEWWIDGAIATDAAGTLYATWDTQGRRADVGWLSYSTDGGASWSSPIRVSLVTAKIAHIVEVSGGPPGIAYVAWLSDRRPWGYAEYLQTFSIAHGWLSRPRRISRRFGKPRVWPGDTFGISTIYPNRVILSWGSAIRGARGKSEIFAAPLGVTLPTG
jgi:hypothetical protein